MKALSASERFKPEKRAKDIDDLQVLLRKSPGPLVFPGSAVAEENKAMVKDLVPFLSKNGRWSEQEWLDRLGL